MWGNRYWPARFWADRYWPPGGDVVPTPTQQPTGGFKKRKRKRKDIERERRKRLLHWLLLMNP